MKATATTTLFTGRDILAAENSLRCAKNVRDALAIAETMPAPVVTRLAALVSANAASLLDVVVRARGPRR
jgi:hypothetical protein